MPFHDISVSRAQKDDKQMAQQEDNKHINLKMVAKDWKAQDLSQCFPQFAESFVGARVL